MSELLTCPHCGGEASYISEKKYSNAVMWSVICDTDECYCKTDGYFHNSVQTEAEAKAKAAAAWNRRASDPLAKELAAALSMSFGRPALHPHEYAMVMNALAKARAAGLLEVKT
jgi:hypothetical protein